MKKIRKRAALIAYRLRLQGLTLDEGARRLGVTGRMLRYLVREERVSRRLRRELARLTGVSYEKLWGEPEPQDDHLKPTGTHD